MQLRIENSVVVITPTIGHSALSKAMESVSNQTYKNLTHLIVIDGREYFEKALKSIPLHDNVAFLDEDNWFDPNHIETLVNTLETKDYDWVHSLRKVYVENDYLADDCCESIGKYPIWFSQPDNPQHLVDTSSYLFKRDFLTKVAHNIHYGWGGDRVLLNSIMHMSNFETSGLHTLNYKLPDMNKAYGGDFMFFGKGNAAIKQQYGGKYPWTE